MPIKAKLTGADALRKRLKVLDRNVFDALSDEMDDIANDLLRKSNDMAPQLTGKMIATSDTDSANQRRAGKLSRSVFYTVEYAIYQHEGNFNPGPVTAGKPGAGRKFLQRPFEQNKQAYTERIARSVQRTLRQTLR